MRHVAPIRKRIGKRTIFNILGPLLNPVEAKKRQVIGVPDPRLLELVADTMVVLGVERALVVHGAPGMDEVSTLGRTQVVEISGDHKEEYQIAPQDYGLEAVTKNELSELDPSHSAQLSRDILDDLVPGRSDIVALNAACGLYVFGKVATIEAGLDLAKKAMDSSRARLHLENILSGGREGE